MDTLRSDAHLAVTLLTDLRNSELDEIIHDDERLETLIQSLERSSLKDIENEKEQLLASNNVLAEANLSREPELVEGREKIKELSEEGERLSKSVADKSREFRDKAGDISIETALALLQTAASEIEEESDNIAKRFLDGEIELDAYLDEFVTKRKVMHMRLVKAEKLAKILSRDPTLSNVPNYVNAPPVNVNSNYFPGMSGPFGPPSSVPNSVPYPVAGINMPMPNMNYFNHY